MAINELKLEPLNPEDTRDLTLWIYSPCKAMFIVLPLVDPDGYHPTCFTLQTVKRSVLSFLNVGGVLVDSGSDPNDINTVAYVLPWNYLNYMGVFRRYSYIDDVGQVVFEQSLIQQAKEQAKQLKAEKKTAKQIKADTLKAVNRLSFSDLF